MGGKFTHARFVSSEKNEIEAIWMSDEGEYTQVAIRTNLENPQYIELLDTFTTDEISTMTDQHSKAEAENFRLYVKEIAMDFGLLYDPNAEQDNNVHSVDHIFEPPEGDEGTDLLFNVKLKIFDMPDVVNSTDDELKRQLREADTPLKALYIAGKFLFE